MEELNIDKSFSQTQKLEKNDLLINFLIFVISFEIWSSWNKHYHFITILLIINTTKNRSFIGGIVMQIWTISKKFVWYYWRKFHPHIGKYAIYTVLELSIKRKNRMFPRFVTPYNKTINNIMKRQMIKAPPLNPRVYIYRYSKNKPERGAFNMFEKYVRKSFTIRKKVENQ